MRTHLFYHLPNAKRSALMLCEVKCAFDVYCASNLVISYLWLRRPRQHVYPKHCQIILNAGDPFTREPQSRPITAVSQCEWQNQRMSPPPQSAWHWTLLRLGGHISSCPASNKGQESIIKPAFMMLDVPRECTKAENTMRISEKWNYWRRWYPASLRSPESCVAWSL